MSSFSSAIMRVVGWRELELGDVSCYSAVDSVGGGGGWMCQHTVAGKIPEIKPGIGDLSHGWF